MNKRSIVKFLELLAKIDWKSLIIVGAALIGAGGAVWNKVETYLDRIIADKTQASTYQVLVDEIEKISARLDTLEKAHVVPPPTIPARRASMTAAVIPEPAPLMLKKLPSFQEIQQRVAEIPDVLAN